MSAPALLSVPFVPRVREGDPGEPQHGIRRIGIDIGEEPLLESLARERRVLEIGTGLGMSTRAMLSARTLVTVDIDPWVHATVWPELPASVIKRDSWPQQLVGGFDLCFIDAEHTAEAVYHDIRRAAGRVRRHGLIVLHDWNMNEVKEGALGAIDGRAPFYSVESRFGLCLVIVSDNLKVAAE